LNCLITSLKELEQEKEMEEERELEQAQIDWEQERLASEKIENKLFLAIARGDIDNVQILINQGANVNKRDNHGNSPLDIAKYRGHTEIVELLKQAGAK
jgi:ankyrin repeat protein